MAGEKQFIPDEPCPRPLPRRTSYFAYKPTEKSSCVFTLDGSPSEVTDELNRLAQSGFVIDTTPYTQEEAEFIRVREHSH